MSRSRFAPGPHGRFEWISFAAVAGPVFLSVPPLRTLDLPLWLAVPLGRLGFWPEWLLAPAWTYVLAEISAMLPRAIRGQRWYERTFPDFPKDRRTVIPYIF